MANTRAGSRWNKCSGGERDDSIDHKYLVSEAELGGVHVEVGINGVEPESWVVEG